MATGKVKWFDDIKGYGFITSDEGKDIFVHHTAIQETGHRSLVEGQNVSFTINESDRGPQAVDVVKLEPILTKTKKESHE